VLPRRPRDPGGEADGVCGTTPCEECRNHLGGDVCAKYIATHYRPLTLEEVGDLMGLTRERIRKIEEAALEKLRDTTPASLCALVQDDPADWYRRPRRMERWRVSDISAIDINPSPGKRAA